LKIRLAIGVIILLIAGYLWTQADFIYGPYAGMVRNTMMVYFGLMAVMAPLVLPTIMKIGLEEVPMFSLGFIVTSVLMLTVPNILTSLLAGQVEANIALVLGFGFLHGFIKAFFEEVIFRGALPTFIGDIWSSVAFGLFHFGITGVPLAGAVFLMGLGYLWAKVRDSMGLMGATGSHFAYNLGVMGILSQMI